MINLPSKLLYAFSICILISCTRAVGYGVILWEDKDWNVETGTPVSIVSDSLIRDEIRFTAEKNSYSSPAWRLIRFESRREAQAFAESFLPLKTIFARATKRSLPIRSEKQTNAEIVYRLDENEIVKIIAVDSQETKLSDLVSKWYEVLTQDGTRGWVFGYYLNVYDAANGEDNADTARPIEELFYTMWRPAYFEEYILTKYIDLDRFGSSFGIGIDPHDALLSIFLPENKNNYSYTNILEGSGQNRYILEGSPIELEFISETRLYAYVKQESGLQRHEFFKLSDPENETAENDFAYIQTLIDAEQQRRDNLLFALLGHSNSFISATYGILLLQDNGNFVWNNYDALVPHVIPDARGNTGSILFSAILEDPDMADGVVAFVFDGSRERIHFAYTVENSGVRLLFVPKNYIETNRVKGLPKTPLTAFFAFE